MYDGNSATFVPQNSIGLTDRCRLTYRQCNPALLHPQIGYILHYRVETTTTTSDGKTFTANKVQRHGCYQPTPMGNTPLWPFYYYKRALDVGTWKDGTSSTTWQGANHHNNLIVVTDKQCNPALLHPQIGYIMEILQHACRRFCLVWLVVTGKQCMMKILRHLYRRFPLVRHSSH
jgi:hypothetical protein